MLRYHERMAGSHRIDVEKGIEILILGYFIGRNFPRSYFCENSRHILLQ